MIHLSSKLFLPLLLLVSCTPREKNKTSRLELSEETQQLGLQLTAKDFIADVVEELGSDKKDAELKVSFEKVLRKHENTIGKIFGPNDKSYSIQDVLKEFGLNEGAAYLKGNKTVQEALNGDLSIAKIIKNPKLGMTRFQLIIADFILAVRNFFQKIGFTFAIDRIDHRIFHGVAKRAPEIRTTFKNKLEYIRNIDNLSENLSVKEEIFGMFDAKLIPESTLNTLEKFSVGYFQYLPDSEKIRIASSFLRADRLNDKFDYMEIALKNSGPTLQKVFQFIGDYIPKDLEKERSRLIAEGISEQDIDKKIKDVERLRGVIERVKSDKMYHIDNTNLEEIVRLATSTGKTSYTEKETRDALSSQSADDFIRKISDEQATKNKVDAWTVKEIKRVAQRSANYDTKVLIGKALLGTQNQTYETIEADEESQKNAITAYSSAFDGDPILIGQASIGRTAGIKTKDGNSAVIKIKRPGADNSFKNELIGFEKSFPAADTSAETARRFMGKITTDVELELDFKNESTNFLVVDKIYKNKGSSGTFEVTDLLSFNTETNRFDKINAVDKIPAQNSSLIVMSRASGAEINTFDGREYTNSKGETFKGAEIIELRKQAVSQLYETWLKESLFKGGDFHADLHSGNIFFDLEKDKEGKSKFILTLIDYGAMGKLSQELQGHAKIFGLGLKNNDTRLILSGLLNISEDPMTDKDLDALTQDIKTAMDNKNLTPIARQEEILRAVGARNVQVPSGFLQFFRGSSFLEKELQNINGIISDDKNGYTNVKPVNIANIHANVGVSADSLLNVNNLKTLIGPATISGFRSLKNAFTTESPENLKNSLQKLRNDIYKSRIEKGKDNQDTRNRFNQFMESQSKKAKR
ncbi:MAG: AarF/UbiB family protein [Oligoflexales bacterium]